MTTTALQPQGCTNLRVRQLMRRVGQQYDIEMARCGLKTTQYSLLSYIVKLGPIRPYALGGLGLMRTVAELSTANILVSENNTLGYSLGGGLMIFFGEHVGIRGDVRVFKTLQDLTLLGFVVPDAQLSFGRASAGLVLKF